MRKTWINCELGVYRNRVWRERGTVKFCHTRERENNSFRVLLIMHLTGLPTNGLTLLRVTLPTSRKLLVLWRISSTLSPHHGLTNNALCKLGWNFWEYLYRNYTNFRSVWCIFSGMSLRFYSSFTSNKLIPLKIEKTPYAQKTYKVKIYARS